MFSQLDVGLVEPGWLSAQWRLQKVHGTSFYRIMNRWKPNQGLHIETGVLVAGPVARGMLSAQWSIEQVSRTPFVRFKNRWKPDHYFHIEGGKVEAGPIEPGWVSAQWLREHVDGTEFVRLQSRCEIHRYLNIEDGALAATPIEPGWLSAQWMKADLAMGVTGVPEILFRFGVHNLKDPNPSVGSPDLGTFKDTFGLAEVLKEFTPYIGHPILTAAFFAFYREFLKGKGNGGLATGFCTALASIVTDNFWTDCTDTFALNLSSIEKQMTAVHGKLLSRQSFVHFHDQGKEGLGRAERTCREVEATFLRGCNRNDAPLIFFIPSGAAWDDGYIDRLKGSHCVMPYRFAYPPGHPGPQLRTDGATTITDLNGVELFVWDCNDPQNPNCKLVFKNDGGQITYDYSFNADISAANGFTLGLMRNGDYMLADHDLPFSSEVGLLPFIIDFLLSPADLQITDANGRRTGRFGGRIHAEIAGSHPCYLVPGAYLLPATAPLTRRIIGTGTGQYTFNSLGRDASVALRNVSTVAGQVDLLSMQPDLSHLRFAPAADKAFDVILSRQMGDQARAFVIRGIGAGPAAVCEISASPELSFVQVSRSAVARQVEVQTLVSDRKRNKLLDRRLPVTLRPEGEFRVDVRNWEALDTLLR